MGKWRDTDLFAFPSDASHIVQRGVTTAAFFQNYEKIMRKSA